MAADEAGPPTAWPAPAAGDAGRALPAATGRRGSRRPRRLRDAAEADGRRRHARKDDAVGAAGDGQAAARTSGQDAGASSRIARGARATPEARRTPPATKKAERKPGDMDRRLRRKPDAGQAPDGAATSWRAPASAKAANAPPGDGRQRSPPLPPLVVREYAHQRTDGTTPEMRTDFAETLYWHPVLVLPDGKAEVSFDLCDSVTTFQVTAFAHTLDGRLGAAHRSCRVAAAVHPAAQDAARSDGQRHDRRAAERRQQHRRDAATSASPLTDARRPGPARRQGRATSFDVAGRHAAAASSTASSRRVKEGEAAPDLRGQDRAVRRRRRARHASASCPKASPSSARTATCWKARRRTTVDAARDLGQGHAQVSGAGLPLDAGRLAEGPGSAAARAERLLRADLDEQLPQPADPRLPQGERPGQAGGRDAVPATCSAAATRS